MKLAARVPPHNWEDYNFGPTPAGQHRLNQGPFSAYGPDATAPGAEVVMSTHPSFKPVPNPGMGLVTYICDEAGPPRIEGESLEAVLGRVRRPSSFLALPVASVFTFLFAAILGGFMKSPDI